MLGSMKVVASLEEFIGRHEATPTLEGLAVSWLAIDLRRSCIDAFSLKARSLDRFAGGLPPNRQQSPLGRDHLSLARLIETHEWHFRPRPETVIGKRKLIEICPHAEFIGQVGWRISRPSVVGTHDSILSPLHGCGNPRSGRV